MIEWKNNAWRRRVNIRAILSNPIRRRDMMVRVVIATQAREGIVTTTEQAERAYDRVMGLRGLRDTNVQISRVENSS